MRTLILILLLFLIPCVSYSTDTGYLNPSAASGTNWTTPTNVYSSNNAYASYTGTTQDVLFISSYGASIPAGSVIDSLHIRFESYSVGLPLARRVYLQFLKAGVQYGSADYYAMPTVEAIDDTYKYALATLGLSYTPAEINASGFGIALWDYNTTASDLNADHVAIKIVYTPPASYPQIF